MKKKTGLILAAIGAGAGFLAGRFVERIVTVKSLVDRIEDIGGSDDLEDYLYDRPLCLRPRADQRGGQRDDGSVYGSGGFGA